MRAQGPSGGVMSSKTGWVIYREVNYRSGGQKLKIGDLTGYPQVVELLIELLRDSLLSSYTFTEIFHLNYPKIFQKLKLRTS